MRIIVMSDSHRYYPAVEKIISLNPDADMFIHLGDGEEDVNRVITKFPEVASRFIHIKGNCDSGNFSPGVYTETVENHRIYAAHGHLQGVNYSLDHIKRIALANNCDIILYGHTHSRFMSYENGVYIMNPGSCSCPRDGNRPSFGSVDITDSGVLTHIADL